MKKFAPCQPDNSVRHEFRDWFDSLPGRMLLAAEKECLERHIPDLFGYHLIQIGDYPFPSSPLASSRIKHRVAVGNGEIRAGVNSPVRGNASMLPIASDSVDAVLLPHTLDFEIDPHKVLRETERILIAEGRVLILGFNPWGLWGIWHLLARRSGRIPWCGRFLGIGRLTDWLSLLGLEVEFSDMLFYRPPLRRPGVMERLEIMERLGLRWWPRLAGVYVVQAVKRVSRLTPIQPKWRRTASLLGGRAVEPTTRSRSDG